MRKRKIVKLISVFVVVNLLTQISFPVTALALTGGPSQPEVQSFEPVGTTQMVDLFSGDFVDNIPLLDVGGYPINISYHAGISMDEEASWVGLGWNINPGAINRNMRGLPDDFNGDQVKKELNMKPNLTFSLGIKPGLELAGFKIDPQNGTAQKNLFNALSLNIFYNNYRGIGWGIDSRFSSSGGKGKLSLGLGYNSQSGIGIDPQLNYEFQLSDKIIKQTLLERFDGVSMGFSYNSMAGLKNMTIKNSLYEHAFKNHESNDGENNSGVSTTFVEETMIPEISMPTSNFSLTIDAGTGAEFSALFPKAHIFGGISGQFIWDNDKTASYPAFGYMYSENGINSDNGLIVKQYKSLLDFNREKDIPFIKDATTHLPVTNFTYDVFSISGQGIGGAFRSHRSDIGTVFDHSVVTSNLPSLKLGPEFGVGNTFKAGQNYGISYTLSQTGRWNDNNLAAPYLNFRSSGNNVTTVPDKYEPSYFKMIGEKTAQIGEGYSGVQDESLYSNMLNDDAVSIPIDGDYLVVTNNLKAELDGKSGSVKTLDNNYSNTRLFRDKRNENITYLDADHASIFGVDKSISDYPLNSDAFSLPNLISRVNDNAKGHHMSEISVTNNNGSRYVYGIPVYNTTQVEKTFAIDAEGDLSTGLVSYDGHSDKADDSKDNTKGIDYFYSSTTLPPYSHAFLLTSILSPDYVDITGDGVTDDDLGNAVQFKYTRAQSDFRWRVPVGKEIANFNQGFYSDPTDNRASYTYGEKEVWYVHSIESKNYVAEFSISERQDAFGVQDKNGDLDFNIPLYKLDKITLYSKQDRMINGGNATPIKTVYFEYDYSLCTGIPNNRDNYTQTNGTYTFNNPATAGKLTLRKIYFTYGKSQKGQLNPYKFYYANGAATGFGTTPQSNLNPSYNIKGYDRWGNYKPNNANSGPWTVNGSLSTSEFPYVDQDDPADKADIYAAAWTMTRIDLPSGGIIKVQYEADDYAYVQDKPTMQMVQTLGSSEQSCVHTLYDQPPFNINTVMTLTPPTPNSYILFKLPASLSKTNYSLSNAADYIKSTYIRDMQQIYFNYLIDISGNNDYEYISGFAPIQSIGVSDGSPSQDDPSYPNWTIGIIYLQNDVVESIFSGIQPVNTNPIARIAWDWSKRHMPKKIFPGSDYIGTTGNNINFSKFSKGLVSGLAGFGQQVLNTAEGFYPAMQSTGRSRFFNPDKSFIRLYSPNGFKKGGGVRVKKIMINDSWGDMTGSANGENFDYGQEYDYTTQDPATKATISSGVAEYEPMLGNDENPLHQPLIYEHKGFFGLGPTDKYIMETPFGESHFPAANVGYSKVTVTNLSRTNIKRTATGKIEHYFYTSKDFPVKTDNTDLKPVSNWSIYLGGILQFDSKDYTTVSQGYKIELNDMHGKAKGEYVYGQDQTTPISKIEYYYFTDPTDPKHLSNRVTVIDPKGRVLLSKEIGKETDFVADMRENKTDTYDFELQGNLDGFFVFFPGLIGDVLPDFNTEHLRFRSAVTTKVIRRYGILQKTVVTDENSVITNNNLAFDSETGDPLVTSTQNEFNDPVYSFTIPAHWAYDGMGQAYINSGLYYFGITFHNSTDILNGAIINPDDGTYNFPDLMPGDEVSLTKIEQPTTSDNGYKEVQTILPDRYWVYPVFSGSNTYYKLIDWDGKLLTDLNTSNDNSITTTYDMTILRSGRRNMQSYAIGQIVSLINPITPSNTLLYNSLSNSTDTKVLNATATVFSDQWDIFACWQRFYKDNTGASFLSVSDRFKPGNIINPYTAGLKGNWRAKQSYTYLTDRTGQDPTSATNIRSDGTYIDFSTFWNKDQNSTFWQPAVSGWTSVSQVTKINPFIAEIENTDPLGKYSSAIYSYNNSLPIGVASNAKYSQIAFDGFEDYDYYYSSYYQPSPHWSFLNVTNIANRSSEFAHSGRYSMKVAAGNTCSECTSLIAGTNPSGDPNGLYILKPSDCIGNFFPDAGSDYIISGWVKESVSSPVFTYSNAKMYADCINSGTNTTTTVEITPSGTIIDGWQRMEGTITIPTGTTGINLRIVSANNDAYFDDIRIHPFHSNMKTYVYDPVSQKLVAELDENNYATFYEYDAEGTLIRVKKETINGVMTLKESRQGIKLDN